MMAVGPVSRAANPRGQIMLPLDLTEPTQVHLRLSVPGRTLREATVTLKPGMAYTLEQRVLRRGDAHTGTPDWHPRRECLGRRGHSDYQRRRL